MEELQKAFWAELNSNGKLETISGPLPIQMKHSDGTGLPLIVCNGFGADIIRFAAGKGVDTHTHEGDHILFVLSGRGFLEYNADDFELMPGMVYLVPGNVPHAIRATSELVLIAVGNNHQPLDSEARLDIGGRTALS